MAIVTWEYYSSLYNTVTEEEFEKLEARAELEVKRVIGPRWAGINEETYGYDVLKDCICKTMNTLASNEASGIGTGLVSVSNDGYSETYAGMGAEEAQYQISGLIKAWLSGTGLVRAY